LTNQQLVLKSKCDFIAFKYFDFSTTFRKWCPKKSWLYGI